MNNHDLLVQDIFIQLYNFKGYSAISYLRNYIIVGFQNRNFVFEVISNDNSSKSHIKWNGKVHRIKSFNEAQRIIMLECLPF